MLSSENDSTTVGRAIAAGAVGFISKSDQDSTAMKRAIALLVQGGVYISEDARRSKPVLNNSPQNQITIKEVGPATLKISAPRVYETLWHISNGATYKVAAKKMGLSQNTVEEYARDGFNALQARTKTDFLVMLTMKGWKLQQPR